MSQTSEIIRDVSTAAAKSVPPITVYALTLNEWVAVATIAYIILQSAHLVWKWLGERPKP